MPPATTSEQAQAAPAPPPPTKAMFAPSGVIVLVIIMVLEGAAVFFVAQQFQSGGADSFQAPESKDRYTQVDLDEYHRQFQDLDATNFVVEQFRLRVALVLNPRYEDQENLKKLVEERKGILQDKAWDVIDAKTELELRQRDLLKDLRGAIKDVVNGELPPTEDGQAIVDKVIFTKRSLLQPKS